MAAISTDESRIAKYNYAQSEIRTFKTFLIELKTFVLRG